MSNAKSTSKSLDVFSEILGKYKPIQLDLDNQLSQKLHRLKQQKKKIKQNKKEIDEYAKDKLSTILGIKKCNRKEY